MPTAQSKVLTAIAAVRDELGHVGKDGTVAFAGVSYKYASEVAISKAIRPLLKKHGLVIIQSVCIEPHVAPRIDECGVTQMVLEFTVAHVSGEVLPIQRVACHGDDHNKNGHGDKGAYKANTGGFKYFLSRLFMVDTGDDPEVVAEDCVASSKGGVTSDVSTRSKAAPKGTPAISEKQRKMLGARTSAKADELLDEALELSLTPEIQDRAGAKMRITKLAKIEVGSHDPIQAREVDPLLKCIEACKIDDAGNIILGKIEP